MIDDPDMEALLRGETLTGQQLVSALARQITRLMSEVHRLRQAVCERNQLLQAAALITDEHDPVGAQLLLEIEQMEDAP